MSYLAADLMDVLHYLAGLLAFALLCCVYALGHDYARRLEARREARNVARHGSREGRRVARALDRADTYGGRA